MTESSSLNYLWNIWNQREFKIPHTQYTIKGFSIAALRSNFFIKELNIMFDAGLSANLSPDHIFVTHTHTDHCANLPYHLYTFNKEDNMKIYVPNGCEKKTNMLIQSVHTINTDEEYNGMYDIVPVKPNEHIDIIIKGKQMRIEIIECDHTVPCVGYGLSEIKRKLKNEYLGMKGNEIVKLKNDNVDIYRNEIHHYFLYLGDTSCEILKNTEIYKYKTIMMECTFIYDDDQENAIHKKHTHWNEIKDTVQNNPHIQFILYHFSGKYKKNEIDEFFTRNSYPNLYIWNSN